MMRTTRAVLAEALFALAFLLLGLFVIYDALTLPEPGVYSTVNPKTFALIKKKKKQKIKITRKYNKPQPQQ